MGDVLAGQRSEATTSICDITSSVQNCIQMYDTRFNSTQCGMQCSNHSSSPHHI